jgi:hypothetical protein
MQGILAGGDKVVWGVLQGLTTSRLCRAGGEGTRARKRIGKVPQALVVTVCTPIFKL